MNPDPFRPASPPPVEELRKSAREAQATGEEHRRASDRLLQETADRLERGTAAVRRHGRPAA